MLFLVSPAGAGCRKPSRHASWPSGLPSITPAALGLRAPPASRCVGDFLVISRHPILYCEVVFMRDRGHGCCILDQLVAQLLIWIFL
jgi:hypothetical protein